MPDPLALGSDAAGDSLLVPYDELVQEGYQQYINQLTAQGYTFPDAILQTQFYRASQTVHNLAVTIAAAQAAGQDAAVAPLKAQLQYWLQQMGATVQQAHTSEAPSALMTALDQFSDQALQLGKKVGVTAANLVDALPYILWGLVILAGLYVFFFVFRARRAVAA